MVVLALRDSPLPFFLKVLRQNTFCWCTDVLFHEESYWISLKFCEFVLSLLPLEKQRSCLLVAGKSLNKPLRKSIHFAAVGLYILRSGCFTTYRMLARGVLVVVVCGVPPPEMWRTDCRYGWYLFYLILSWLSLTSQLCSVGWSIQILKGPGQRPVHPYNGRERSWEDR